MSDLQRYAPAYRQAKRGWQRRAERLAGQPDDCPKCAEMRARVRELERLVSEECGVGMTDKVS
jgi:hypothetical protein